MKLSMVRWLAIGLILFYSLEAWGADWKWFAETDSYECYYDAEDSSPSSNNIVEVWARLEYTRKGVIEVVRKFGSHYTDLSYSLKLVEINCAAKKGRILSLTEYSADGKVLYAKSVQGRLPAWKTIARESIDESLYKTVCR